MHYTCLLEIQRIGVLRSVYFWQEEACPVSLKSNGYILPSIMYAQIALTSARLMHVSLSAGMQPSALLKNTIWHDERNLKTQLDFCYGTGSCIGRTWKQCWLGEKRQQPTFPDRKRNILLFSMSGLSPSHITHSLLFPSKLARSKGALDVECSTPRGRFKFKVKQTE